MACILLWRFWFQSWHSFSKFSIPNSRVWSFWDKKYEFFNLHKILSASYFKDADFKSDICLHKFRVQILKFGGFGPKQSNLNKVVLHFPYFDSGDVNYCIRTKIHNCGNDGPKPINSSGEILLWCWFHVWNFFNNKSEETKKQNNTWNNITWNFITSLIRINYFVFWFCLLN